MKGGAPNASWRERAPIILARSKRVSFGGPIVTSKVSLFSCSTVFIFFRLTFCWEDTLVRGTVGREEKTPRISKFLFGAQINLTRTRRPNLKISEQ